MDEPEVLWRPSAAAQRGSGFARWLDWLARERDLHLSGYAEAWAWSTTEIEAFWESVAIFLDVRFDAPYRSVLDARRMPGARWFDGAELNYAAHIFHRQTVDRPALLWTSETAPLAALPWSALGRQVAAVASALRELGVRRGDRVAAILPNAPEAVIAFLACAAIGAIWSCCSPEYGAAGVLGRFRQIEPRVLFAADGYTYGGRAFDRRAVIEDVRRALPTLRHVVLVPQLDVAAKLSGTLRWHDLLQRDAPLTFDPVPFDHPLWILYSSGTTGAPKAIVHGHGGVLIEQLKSHVIQNDMRPGDRFFWSTTTGWMMWNSLVGGLLAGCTIVLRDGSAAHPDLGVTWRLVQDARVTRFGAGAAFFTACMNAGLEPGRRCDLTALRAIGSTGSPLPAAAFRWIYEAVRRDVWLASSSGGSDVATAFLGGCPQQPVRAGELQGAALGVRAAAFDEDGAPVIGRAGELVVLEPMPSMPIRLWNDHDGTLYRQAWFDMYPGVWRQGDLVTFTPGGGAVIHGRSDATLNRYGVRMGTGEIHAVVEALPDVADSLVVGVELPEGGYWMPLFVVLRDGAVLDDDRRSAIAGAIRSALTPRHVPDEIIAVDAVPRTHNGKKMEVPVRRVLQGMTPDRAADPASLANPAALAAFVRFVRRPA